jgi:translin
MINDITAKILEDFDSKDNAREKGLTLSRNVVRICRSVMYNIHNKKFDKANKMLNDAHESLEQINTELGIYPDIYYGGFVGHAQQEYVECVVVYHLLYNKGDINKIPSPDDLNVGYAAYLNGMADAGGELRRHILDLIRQDKPEKGETYLDIMESMFSNLMMFDYPDAITHNLRQKTDRLRSIVERTRGDLTNALRQQKLEETMKKFESKL